ncbi:TPA: hypothetical protein EYN23_18970 [Candidatus Poribacteria bacterium]|nr:hypothetical protein [Candidatus Poribacteria bacterium]
MAATDALPIKKVTIGELTSGYTDVHKVALGDPTPHAKGGRVATLYGSGTEGQNLTYTARKDGTQPAPKTTALADLLKSSTADGTLPSDFSINEYSLAHFDKKLLNLHRSIMVLQDPIGSLRLKLSDLYQVRNYYLKEVEKISNNYQRLEMLSPSEAMTKAEQYISYPLKQDLLLLDTKYPSLGSLADDTITPGGLAPRPLGHRVTLPRP